MTMRTILTACLGAGLAMHAAAVPAADTGVLVAPVSSPVATLPPADVRKAYLGVPVTINGETLLPLRNTSDPVLEEAFLQKVLFMSRDAYERLLLTRVMRGGVRPGSYDSETQLLNALTANRATITYMWENKSGKTGIKVVTKLWQASE